MNRQANPAGGDQTDVLTIVAAAARLLVDRKSAVPEAFVAKLFGLAAPEDLRHCGAAELANIAEQSWSFLAERRIAGQLPHRRTVRHQTIITAVMRRNRDRNHFALELAQAGRGQHQIVVHGDEG